MSNKIIKTINQNRQVKSAINPKAIQRSENVIASYIVYSRDRPTVVEGQDISDMAVWDSSLTTWDGNDTNDEWDSYDSSTIAPIRVINKNNLFIETFDYDYFVGSSTTATLSTSNRSVTFTSGQILYIEPMFKDSSSTEIVTRATPAVTIDSGAFDIELSADGGANWESATNNAQHTFTNTGSDLRMRITENNSSTGSISLIRCSYIK